MTYQIINYSTLQSPQSLDEYDVNIVDLTSDSLWCYDGQQPKSINKINDFISLQKMAECSRSTFLLFVLPGNVDFRYHKHFNIERYVYNSIKMKDNIPNLWAEILPHILPDGLYLPELVYENTRTQICEMTYNASFYFETNRDVLSESIKIGYCVLFCFGIFLSMNISFSFLFLFIPYNVI